MAELPHRQRKEGNMDRIKGLREYIETESFKEQLGIPRGEKIECRLLAQGEYNINYEFVHPVSKADSKGEHRKSDAFGRSNRI